MILLYNSCFSETQERPGIAVQNVQANFRLAPKCDHLPRIVLKFNNGGNYL